MSFSCVLRRRVFVINSLFYDACFAEKSQDLIFPQESILFDSTGFYNTFRFTSLRGRDFVPKEMADILGNHWPGCSGCRYSMVGLISIPASRYNLISIQTANEGPWLKLLFLPAS